MAYNYKKIKSQDGSTRDEHRIIMEDHLGRSLLRNEVVHHRDGDKFNNQITNLQLISLAEHTRSHVKSKQGFSSLYFSKMEDADKSYIKYLSENGMSATRIATYFNTTSKRIIKILQNK